MNELRPTAASQAPIQISIKAKYISLPNPITILMIINKNNSNVNSTVKGCFFFKPKQHISMIIVINSRLTIYVYIILSCQKRKGVLKIKKEK